MMVISTLSPCNKQGADRYLILALTTLTTKNRKVKQIYACYTRKKKQNLHLAPDKILMPYNFSRILMFYKQEYLIDLLNWPLPQ